MKAEQPSTSAQTQNWTFHEKPFLGIQIQEPNVDDENDDERVGLGCNQINGDVMYCIKLKVRIGSKVEYWKVLMDTGSKLNIVNNTVVDTHLIRPTTCPKVATSSGDIITTSEVRVDIFLTDSIGINVDCPIVTGMDCTMYSGTPFFQNFQKHGVKFDQ